MNEKVAQRIKELRLKTGLSQEGLSYLAELDRKYIGIIEKGNTNISIQVLSQICEALDVSLSEFFEEFDNERNRFLVIKYFETLRNCSVNQHPY